MAETTQFDHDQIGHLLADHLLEVPRFQRSYAWESGNVDEYLADLKSARERDVNYFMGTLVFAKPGTASERRTIVDGQQRLATTAILLIAIRDLLNAYNKRKQAAQLEQRYLRGYVLAAEKDVERLVLSPRDNESYDALLDGDADTLRQGDPLGICYQTCWAHLRSIAPSPRHYRKLLQISEQLENRVQVLVAVATDLPEAYVIFETLNDRGADLTTADLLKNYLFSQAGSAAFRYVETKWIELEASFDKPDELVKFIRYEYISRNGSVSVRKLYRAIQEELTGPSAAKKYLQRLVKAQKVYGALRDPGNPYWAGIESDVQDALLAYRRYGFESSLPLLLAAFMNWTKNDASKLLVKTAKWSVRAQFVGRIGASLSEEAFGEAAEAVSQKTAKNQNAVRNHLAKLIPTDTEFKAAFVSAGPVTVSRAKYLLAMLEKAHRAAEKMPAIPLDWASTGVTIEHVLAESSGRSDDALAAVVNRLGNLALLEKKINRDLADKPFPEKKAEYAKSAFGLTAELASEDDWTSENIQARVEKLARLACSAWTYR